MQKRISFQNPQNKCFLTSWIKPKPPQTPLNAAFPHQTKPAVAPSALAQRGTDLSAPLGTFHHLETAGHQRHPTVVSLKDLAINAISALPRFCSSPKTAFWLPMEASSARSQSSSTTSEASLRSCHSIGPWAPPARSSPKTSKAWEM